MVWDQSGEGSLSGIQVRKETAAEGGNGNNDFGG